MARRKRICYPGATYHVFSRGNRKSRIFLTDQDRLHFLEALADAWEKYHARWRFIMQMKTHYHTYLQTPLPNISDIMRQVNGLFAQAWNARHGKTGHVFGEPFQAVLVEDDRYAQTLLRYIAWNPVEAGYVKHPRDWPWSSYRATAGLEPAPAYLDLSWLRGFFGCPTISAARQAFVECIDDGPVEENILNEIVLGSEPFKALIRQEIGASMHKLIVPRSYRALGRPSLGVLFNGITADLEARNVMIRRAHVVHGYRLSEIARSLNLHPNSVSRIQRRLQRQTSFLVHVK
jgi:REP element-mobilizing transposase RayT